MARLVFYPIWEAATVDEWLYNGGPYQLVVCHFFIGICCYMGREWELSYRLGKRTSQYLDCVVSNASPEKLQTTFQASGELSRRQETSEGKGFILPTSNKFFELFKNFKNKDTDIYLTFIGKMSEKNKFYKQCYKTVDNKRITYWLDTRTDCPIYLEKHRVDPAHEGGTYTNENTILLTFSEHTMARYLRYLQYGNPSDKLAYTLMLSQDNTEARRELARIAGRIGGKAVQKMLKQQGRGWYNSELQTKNGIKGAAAAKAAGTGFFDPQTNALGVAAWTKKYKSDEEFADKMKLNLRQGIETQRQFKINVFDSKSQRVKSVRYRGIVINGVHWSAEIPMLISGKMVYSEARTHVSETFFWYYML